MAYWYTYAFHGDRDISTGRWISHSRRFVNLVFWISWRSKIHRHRVSLLIKSVVVWWKIRYKSSRCALTFWSFFGRVISILSWWWELSSRNCFFHFLRFLFMAFLALAVIVNVFVITFKILILCVYNQLRGRLFSLKDLLLKGVMLNSKVKTWTRLNTCCCIWLS